jgi:cadmium resistance protein CadD (predicted permease)
VTWLWQAVVLFAVTNIDDVVVLSLFFGRASGVTGSTRRIVAGQYLGFVVILAVSLAGAFGAGQLSDRTVACLGLVPVAIGLWSAYSAWRERGTDDTPSPRALTTWTVTAVTVANGGDNIGVYVPAFASRSVAELAGIAVVFLVLVTGLCLAGRAVAQHHLVAAAMRRWGHIVYPVALIAVGLAVLVSGGALG